MHVVERQAAQGDLLILRVNQIPSGLEGTLMTREEEILSPSASGHHHMMVAKGEVRLFQAVKENGVQMRTFIKVEPDAIVKIEHRRSVDSHAPLQLLPGLYEVRRQREHTPDGWRRVED